MANTLKFTSECFMQCRSATASISANTKFDILSTSSNTRKIYGISLVSSDNATQTIKIYLNDGVSSYQIYLFSLAAGAGTNGTTSALDVFGSSLSQSIFQKMRDNNGMSYFNLPPNWKVEMEFNTTLGVGELINSFVFGETYV
jgi:hypothetical protein